MKKLWSLSFLFLLSIFPFLINLRDFFVSDDWDFITVYSQANSFFQLFVTNTLGGTIGGSYRPIGSVLWYASAHLWQLNPLPLHALWIVLHGLNTLLVYQLGKRFFHSSQHVERYGLIAGLVFAVLPNHAEPVIWLSAPDVFMTTFFISSLLLIDWSLLAESRKKVLLVVGSLVCALGALFSKEMALPLFLVIFLWVLLVYPAAKLLPRIKRAALISSPYLLLTGVYMAARYRATGLLFGYYGPQQTFSLRDSLSTEVELLVSHFVSDERFLFVQQHLLPHLKFLSIICLLFLIGTIVAIKQRWIKEPNKLMIVLLYLITTFPVVTLHFNFIPFYFSNEGQRLAYLPSVFFCLGVAWLFSLFRHRLLSIVALATLSVLLYLQLLPQTIRWHQASQIAQSSVNEITQLLKESPYNGVVLLGTPDQLHGALIFRNSFIKALAFARNDSAVILGIFNRTLIKEDTSFIFQATNTRESTYTASNKQPLVASPSKLSSIDLSASLTQPVIVERSNYRTVGNELKLTLSAALTKTNRIAVLYFDGAHWRLGSVTNR